MDGDPGVESEVDSFSLFLPLPYRVAIILVSGWCASWERRAHLADTIRHMGMGIQSSISPPRQD